MVAYGGLSLTPQHLSDGVSSVTNRRTPVVAAFMFNCTLEGSESMRIGDCLVDDFIICRILLPINMSTETITRQSL